MTLYKNMDQLPAFKTLVKLSARPYDLTRKEALPQERLYSYRCQTAGFELLYATQRLDDQVLAALQTLADQSRCVEQFVAMKQGARINRIEDFESENRQVLHTASRDIFGDRPAEPQATAEALRELEKLRVFLDKIDRSELTNARQEPFTDLINIGIGGSDLGPRALYHGLKAFAKPGRQVHFISNVDPDDAAGVLKGLNLSTTLVNVVSKSGSTLETLTNEELVRAAFTKAGLDPGRHFIAVTGESSPMNNPDRYLASFYMFDYIGGRYSVCSMVGAVMLGFALGYDGFIEILGGANQVDQAAENTDIRQNLPLIMALIGIWNHNFLNHETVAILPYSQALVRFAAHLQQCDMESNGKSINRSGQKLNYQTGPIVWGEPGTNGQHAFYQLLHQGTTIVPAEFIGFRQSQYGEDMEIRGTTSQEKLVANLLAQSLALATGRHSDNPNRHFAGNRMNSVLIADRLTPRAMGALLAIYENRIAMQGMIWNINSFDQEGVQLGKLLADRLLGHLAAGRLKPPNANGVDADPLGRSLLRAAGIIT